jgi:hypothetical protein
MLKADLGAPRKQRHTAHRIWQRIKEEVPGSEVSERSIRKYVRKRRLALGLIGRETCVPQSYPWGSEAQVDWYEAYADLGAVRASSRMRSIGRKSPRAGLALYHRVAGLALRAGSPSWVQSSFSSSP